MPHVFPRTLDLMGEKADNEGRRVHLHSAASLIQRVPSLLPECFPSVLLYLVLWTLALVGREVESWEGKALVISRGLVCKSKLSQTRGSTCAEKLKQVPTILAEDGGIVEVV